MSSEDLRNFDYSRADSIAIAFGPGKGKSSGEITLGLVSQLQTDHEKFRVIFRWISENISYKDHYYVTDPEKVLSKRKTVCSGYSSLLDRMCEHAGIECEVIIGFAKTNYRHIGVMPNESNHSWNAVRLYDQWYLCDATWATSSFSLDEKEHIKEFDENYFLSPPASFILQHFPDDSKWQLSDNHMSRSEFAALPVFYSQFFNLKISGVEPLEGLVRARSGKNLTFDFNTSSSMGRASLRVNNESIPGLISTGSEKQVITFQIPQSKGDRAATLFIGGKGIMVFKLRIV
jgi:hypothetical protein